MDKKILIVLLVMLVFFSSVATAFSWDDIEDFVEDIFHHHHHHNEQPATDPIPAALPQALNVELFPQFPMENQVIYCAYDYYDAARSPEAGTIINWLKNGVMTPYTGLTLTAGIAKRNENWRCQVTPKAADRRIGYVRQSAERTIGYIDSIPELKDFSDVNIAVNKQSKTVVFDLWDFATDDYDSPSEMKYVLIDSNKALIDCNVFGNRYVECSAPTTNLTGYSDVIVFVTNSLGNSTSKGFRINVVNTAPRIGLIGNQTIRKNTTDTTRILDLYSVVTDAEQAKADLNYSLISQSNSALVNCYIDSNRYLTCSAPTTDNVGTNTLTIRVTDSFGATAEREINIVVANAAPVFSEMPIITVKKDSKDSFRAIDVFDYVSDADDTDGNLSLTIVSQSDKNLIDCSLDSNRYVYCSAPTASRIGSNIVSIKAQDKNNSFAIGLLTIRVEDTFLDFNFGKNFVSLAPGQTAEMLITIANNSTEKKCYSFKATSSSTSNITAKIPTESKSLCLNSNEKTSFSISISALDDAANGEYKINFIVNDGNSEISKSVKVEVSRDSQLIELQAFNKSICRNRYNQSLNVLVKNNSNDSQEITLRGESETFLPYFEPETITLDSGEDQYVELKLNVNKTTALGDYSIPLAAITDNATVQGKAEFSVIDCSDTEPKEKILDIIVTKNCVIAEKGKTTFVPFRVKNLSKEIQKVSLAVTGAVPAEVSRKTITIEPNASFSLDLNLMPETDTPTGKQTETLWAWNNNDRVGVDVCVEVGKVRDMEIEQLNNNIEVPRDDAGIISFNVKNTGDFTESVSISIRNTTPNVTITTANPTIQLGKGEQKTVFVVVSPNLEADLGNKEATVTFNGAAKTITAKINYNVIKERTPVKINVIKIISYPEKISATAGATANYEITIENPTNEKITGLSLIIGNLPEGATSAIQTGIRLNPKEKKTISGTIEFSSATKAGTYNANFEIKNNEYKTTKTFKIELMEQGAFGAGLFGLASNILLGIIVLVIVVFIVTRLNSNAPSRRSKRRHEPWVSQQKNQA